MTVVNYSVQDIISPERRVFVGTEWFAAVMRDTELHGALWRQLQFSLAVLAVEIPLGIALALSMPAQGWKASAVLVVVALSLLIPWNVVGTMLGYSAMAGIVGGGGLGDIAIRYGYYRYDSSIMWVTVVLLIVLVQLMQYVGMKLSKKLDKRTR